MSSTIHETECALAHIASIGRPDYPTWLRLLSGCVNEYGAGIGAALMVDAFGDDRPGVTLAKARTALDKVGIGTVFHIALQCGYKPLYGTQRAPTTQRSTPKPKPAPAPVATPLPYTAFGYREQVVGSIHNRGTILPMYNLTQDFGRLRCEGYHSLFLHPVALLEYAEDQKARKGKASIAGYTGPCWVDRLQVDFDDADLDKALSVARMWAKEFGEAEYYFTGSKGFRAAFQDIFPDKRNGRLDTPAECSGLVKGIALRVAGNVDCIDFSIYTTTHLIRVPNSQHQKTGLFQIPLSAVEICTLSIAEIQALAVAPRNLAPESTLESICL